jgi:hypothetical protein
VWGSQLLLKVISPSFCLFAFAFLLLPFSFFRMFFSPLPDKESDGDEGEDKEHAHCYQD